MSDAEWREHEETCVRVLRSEVSTYPDTPAFWAGFYDVKLVAQRNDPHYWAGVEIRSLIGQLVIVRSKLLTKRNLDALHAQFGVDSAFVASLAPTRSCQ
jgi:hypothetical protein